ncbi:MAG: hypothetical protein HUJ42_02335 [Malacoplasma sp.]|nr:hypothetical protein [Malacoplasma sp.]
MKKKNIITLVSISSLAMLSIAGISINSYLNNFNVDQNNSITKINSTNNSATSTANQTGLSLLENAVKYNNQFYSNDSVYSNNTANNPFMYQTVTNYAAVQTKTNYYDATNYKLTDNVFINKTNLPVKNTYFNYSLVNKMQYFNQNNFSSLDQNAQNKILNTYSNEQIQLNNYSDKDGYSSVVFDNQSIDKSFSKNFNFTNIKQTKNTNYGFFNLENYSYNVTPSKNGVIDKKYFGGNVDSLEDNWILIGSPQNFFNQTAFGKILIKNKDGSVVHNMNSAWSTNISNISLFNGFDLNQIGWLEIQGTGKYLNVDYQITNLGHEKYTSDINQLTLHYDPYTPVQYYNSQLSMVSMKSGAWFWIESPDATDNHRVYLQFDTKVDSDGNTYAYLKSWYIKIKLKTKYELKLDSNVSIDSTNNNFAVISNFDYSKFFQFNSSYWQNKVGISVRSDLINTAYDLYQLKNLYNQVVSTMNSYKSGTQKYKQYETLKNNILKLNNTCDNYYAQFNLLNNDKTVSNYSNTAKLSQFTDFENTLGFKLDDVNNWDLPWIAIVSVFSNNQITLNYKTLSKKDYQTATNHQLVIWNGSVFANNLFFTNDFSNNVVALVDLTNSKKAIDNQSDSFSLNYWFFS